MSYQLKVDPKSRKATRFISQIQKKLQAALLSSGKSQQEVANILGVDRSVVNRRLLGKSNLTARSIAEFAYALDKDIEFYFVDKNRPDRVNFSTTASPSPALNLQSLDRNATTSVMKIEQPYLIESASS